MQVKSNEFEFRKASKVLVMSGFEASFPAQIDVESSASGRIVRFVVDQEAAMDNEFWDGEEMHYVPSEALPNVKHLVLSHM